MPRLVRRTPLLDRVKAYLDPLDFLLWLSEELTTQDWDDFNKQWATPTGIVFNVLFMIARSNSSASSQDYSGDVFGDDSSTSGTGWLAWFAAFVSHILTLISICNAGYTFWRRRHYRLFESSIDKAPQTKSAHRVPVNSSPISSSPWRYISGVLGASSADSRAHPDPSRDVWELEVWDPTPLCLRTFCLFSPGHVLVYWLFLPLDPLDPRPSVTVVKTALLAILLSTQLFILQSSFSQQSKDSALLQQEVQNEYKTKFVHPLLFKPVRDAGTQSAPSAKTPGKIREVLTFMPTTYVNRGFHTNPNPNYAPQYDPHSVEQSMEQRQSLRAASTPTFSTPSASSTLGMSSPLRPGDTSGLRRTSYGNMPTGTGARDGGNLRVYSHASSPLKASDTPGSAQRSRLSAAPEGIRNRTPGRQGNPLKTSTTPGGGEYHDGSGLQQRFSHLRGDGLRRQSGRF